MSTLHRLRPRVERVILISPALTQRAFSFSPARRRWMRRAAALLRRLGSRAALLAAAKSPAFSGALGRLLRWFGRVEETIPMHEVFAKLTDSTLEVLSYQLVETLEYELPAGQAPPRSPKLLACPSATAAGFRGPPGRSPGRLHPPEIQRRISPTTNRRSRPPSPR
ncbi:MAG: hypothetical protein KIS85_02915 [Anaerolineales bacterium]|nr:hypothetical protein [Anaerolineales bacterium]